MKLLFSIFAISIHSLCLANNCNFLAQKENYIPPRKLQAQQLNWLQSNLYKDDKSIDKEFERLIADADENTSFKAKLDFLFGIRLQEQSPPRAKTFLKNAASSNRLSSNDKLFIAKIFMKQMIGEKKLQSALFCSNLITKYHPDQTDYYFISAQIMAQKGNWTGAQKKCVDGLNRLKDPNENYLKMCEVVYKKNESYSAALAIMQTLIRKRPLNENYWLEKSYLLKKLDKPIAAFNNLKLAHIRGILKRKSSIKNLIYSELNAGLPLLAYQDMKALDEIGEEIKITSLLRAKSYDLLTDRLLAKRQSLDSKQLELLADILLYNRAYKEAVPIYTELVEKKVLVKKSLYQLGRLEYLLDHKKKALTYFRRADKAGNEMAKAWINFLNTTQ